MRGNIERRAAALVAAFAFGLSGAPRAEEAPALALPVDCVLGESCAIQDYVDVDPGPSALDYGCGARTRDGHNGVDIRLRSLSDLSENIGVLAAAPGRVARLRDGEQDKLFTPGEDLGGRDCGNGVVVEHAGGWSTQYCHLKRGSLTVREGDQVAAGDRLGAVGLSGRTTFPHLHFTLRRGREVIDPFTSRALDGSCAGDAASLWAETPDYQPVTLLDARFSRRAPRFADIRRGEDRDEQFLANGPALTFWVRLLGMRAGDVIALRITTPSGDTLAELAEPMEKDQAVHFRFIGKRLRAERWPPGLYRGHVSVTRDGEAILTRERRVAIE